MTAGGIFIEISIVLVIALIISLITKLFRQPAIIGYIITGIIISPYAFNIIQSNSDIQVFGKIGVAFLLFMHGLKLNPKVMKDVGPVSLITGLGQITFTFIIGYLIASTLGFSQITSAYIAIALSFSSTIIVLKLLSDMEDEVTLYGRIVTGFLIVQDIVAIIVLMFISSMIGETSFSSIAIERLSYGGLILLGLVAFSIIILPFLTRIISKSQELLLLFSVGWALAIASLFYSAGFSVEIGALLAGVALSSSPYRYEMNSRLKPLKDFFLLIFFITLGTQMNFTTATNYITPAIIFSLLVLIGNPLIVMSIMGIMGYKKRSGFLAGLTVSQISEFSFILILLGVTAGHISQDIISLITVVGIITIGGSTYAITRGKKFYQHLIKPLSLFERKDIKFDEGKFHYSEDYEIFLFGYNRIGYNLLKPFRKTKKKFLVVDYNPKTIIKLAERGYDGRYGDASDPELLDELPLKKAKMIFSTIPDMEVNKILIKKVKEVNKKAVIIAVSHHIDESLELYKAGASYIISPHFIGGVYASHLIEKYGLKPSAYENEKKKSLKELKARKREGHRDPLHERG